MSRQEARSHRQRTGVPVSCARPCLTALCAAFLAPEDGLCPSPCSLPAHRERRNTGDVRTYLPRAHGNRQRVCLSHLCFWIGVWRRKEKPFLLQHVPVHPCCLLARLGDGSVPATHSACSRTTAPLLGTSHTSHSKTFIPAPGWGREHSRGLWDTSKAGCSLLSIVVPLLSSLPWHGACVPTRARCPIPLSPSPKKHP